MAVTIVKPQGEQRDRLLENIGRDTWRYGGQMEPGSVRHTLDGKTQIVPVFYYEFDKILDDDVKVQYIRSRAAMHNTTLEEAEAFCRTHPLAMPQEHVVLEVQTKAFQGETMTCCMCGREQQHTPGVQSQWTWIEMDGFGAHVCPSCLQHSKQAQRGHYATVYEKVLRRILRLRARHQRGLNN